MTLTPEEVEKIADAVMKQYKAHKLQVVQTSNKLAFMTLGGAGACMLLYKLVKH